MDITILKKDQIFGSSELEIFKKRGVQAAISDYAICCGGFVSSSCYIGNNQKLENRTGWYWTKTDDGDNDARVVDFDGNDYNYFVNNRSGVVRPALPFSSISSICSNRVRAQDGILEVEYGEYPQTAVSKELQKTLEKLFKTRRLVKTGKSYTRDSVPYDRYADRFQAERQEEYEYNGKKYVRIKVNSCFNRSKFKLSNGEEYQYEDYVWIEVKPIKWLVDEERNIAITEKILFAGVQFKNTRDYKGDFENTDLYYYMDTYFSKEMESIVIQNAIGQENESIVSSRSNPYDFDFREVTEEEMIRGYVESGIAVFLHGLSSDGKSSRVKQIDPDCEIVYLITANADSFAGKSVYNQATGEMIDIKPTWLKRLEDKCQKEPNKIHILFLDEMTNVRSNHILNLSYNLVLDRELDGKWKLPENARIVAAGNETKDSTSAIEMPQPLYNRFGHVYIHTTVEDWLIWASTPIEEYEKLDYQEEKVEKKIHPSIYAFISYRGEEVLRTEYTGKQPNADPRKWEMASKVLYKTRRPEMLRALIGEELTMEFIGFCSKRVITLEDVLSGNYEEKDLEMDISEKAATALALSRVEEEQIETVRSFMKKLGNEALSLFETLWVQGDNSRLEKLIELEGANQR